jgi:uncharacterized protein (DUF305 family)
VDTPGPTTDERSDQLPELDGPLEAADGDGTIVLPWWQHPVNILTLLVSFALVAGMIGWMVGDANASDDPNEVDVGFLQDMRVHHEQAVAMGFIFLSLDDTDPGLRTVARSIVFGQGIDIGRMIQLLRGFGAAEANEGETSMGWMGMPTEVGQMPGIATPDQLDELSASSGAEADRAFVDLMTAHHLGGIDMAAFAAEEAATSEVRAMAASIADSQGDEIREMQDLVP